jgi:transcriptional regulator with XRE-family HTH domain
MKTPLTKYSKQVTKAVLYFIDTLKRDKGISNDKEIAGKIGCVPQTITYWRNGQRSVTIDQIGALIKEYGMDPNTIFNPGSIRPDQRIDKLELRISYLENLAGKKSGKN